MSMVLQIFANFTVFVNFVIFRNFRNFGRTFLATLGINFVDFVDGLNNYCKFHSFCNCIQSWALLIKACDYWTTCDSVRKRHTLHMRRATLSFNWPIKICKHLKFTYMCKIKIRQCKGLSVNDKKKKQNLKLSLRYTIYFLQLSFLKP